MQPPAPSPLPWSSPLPGSSSCSFPCLLLLPRTLPCHQGCRPEASHAKFKGLRSLPPPRSSPLPGAILLQRPMPAAAAKDSSPLRCSQGRLYLLSACRCCQGLRPCHMPRSSPPPGSSSCSFHPRAASHACYCCRGIFPAARAVVLQPPAPCSRPRPQVPASAKVFPTAKVVLLQLPTACYCCQGLFPTARVVPCSFLHPAGTCCTCRDLLCLLSPAVFCCGMTKTFNWFD